MLHKIKLSRFKGVKNGEISGFGDVNILIGPNNSGKSTILDSIYLLNHIFDPTDVLGNYIPKYITSKKAGNTNLKSLHYKYREDESAVLHPHLKTKKVGLSIGMAYNMTDWSIANSLNIKDNIQEGKIQREYGREDYSTSYDTLFENLKRFQNNDLLEYYSHLYESVHPTFYMHSGIFQVLEQIERKVWGELHQERKDKRVINKLNDIYDSDIDQLSYVPIEDDYEFQILFDDYAAQPGSMGDGFRYAFSLFSGIEAFSPNTVLVEEPENHQHPSAYQGIADAIKEYAEELDIQFFIATHSLDFLNLLIDGDIGTELEISIFHLSLIDGHLEVRNIDKPDLEVMNDLGIDPLRLKEYRGEKNE